MGKKKFFIKKGEGLQFSVIHRSQKDPLIADSSAGERILAPIVQNKRKEEQLQYGIYYDNDYDYLQHLKDTNEVLADDIEDRTVIKVPKDAIKLPSTMFETKGVELKIGLLNQAAPSNSLNLNIDPEVAAYLDGEAQIDDEELEDDFMQLANGEGDEIMEDDEYAEGSMMDEKAGRANIMERFGLVREKFSDESSEDEDMNDFDDFEDNGNQDYSQGKRNKLTDLMTSGSISSAIMPRSEGLRNIDEHFDKICEEYDDEHIGYGASEEENEESDEDEDVPREEWKRQLEEMEGTNKIRFDELQCPSEDVKVKTLLMAAKSEKQPEKMERVTLDTQNRKRNHWDCESILSTYSTAYNHPTVIREPSKKKIGITNKDLKEIDSMDIDKISVISGTSISTYRPKGETAEERRLRKQGIKEQQRERRVEKKMNKLAFKEEKRTMDKQASRIQVKGRTIA
jgi:protein LTV1